MGPAHGEAIALEAIHELAGRADRDAEISAELVHSARGGVSLDHAKRLQSAESHAAIARHRVVDRVPEIGLVANHVVEETHAAFDAHAPTIFPGIHSAPPVPSPRARCYWGRAGELLDDFAVDQIGLVTLLRNAPSPAGTSSLAIADYIIEHYLAKVAA